MHKLSTAVPQSSTLTALCDPQAGTPELLVPRFIDTVAFVASATASSSRSDDDAMSGASRRRRDKEIDAVPPPPFGLMGVAGDLCVARRRRCPCIAFSSLLDLASQAPSANITISMKRGTERTARVRLRGPTRSGCPRTPCHRDACDTSLRQPMHDPGYPVRARTRATRFLSGRTSPMSTVGSYSRERGVSII